MLEYTPRWAGALAGRVCAGAAAQLRDAGAGCSAVAPGPARPGLPGAGAASPPLGPPARLRRRASGGPASEGTGGAGAAEHRVRDRDSDGGAGRAAAGAGGAGALRHGAPFASAIPPGPLTLIPHGPLHQLPFEALRLSRGPAGAPILSARWARVMTWSPASSCSASWPPWCCSSPIRRAAGAVCARDRARGRSSPGVWHRLRQRDEDQGVRGLPMACRQRRAVPMVPLPGGGVALGVWCPARQHGRDLSDRNRRG